MKLVTFFLQTLFIVLSQSFGVRGQNVNGTTSDQYLYSTASPYSSSLQIGSVSFSQPLNGDLRLWYQPQSIRFVGVIDGFAPMMDSKVSVGGFSVCPNTNEDILEWWNSVELTNNPWQLNVVSDSSGRALVDVSVDADAVGYDLIEIVNHPILVSDANQTVLSCTSINSVGVLSTVLFSDQQHTLVNIHSNTKSGISYLNYFATSEYFQLSGFLNGGGEFTAVVEIQILSNSELSESERCQSDAFVYRTNNTDIIPTPANKEYVYWLETNVDELSPLQLYDGLIKIRTFNSSGAVTSSDCNQLMIFVDEWDVRLREPKIEVVFSDVTSSEEIRLFYLKTPYRNHTVELFARDCTQRLANNVIRMSSALVSPVGELDLLFDVSTDLLLANGDSDESGVQVFFQSTESSSIEFCVRVSLNVVSTGEDGESEIVTPVSFLDTVVLISLDLTLNFEIAEGFVFPRGDPSVVTQNAIIDYNIEACLCETPTVVRGDTCGGTLPELSDALEPGDILGLCINTDSESVVVARIVELQFLQDGQEKGPRPVNNGIFSELTSLATTNGLTTKGRNIALTSRLVDAFFTANPDSSLLIRGVVEIEFSGTDANRGSRKRFLQDASTTPASVALTAQKVFELSVDVDGEVYLSVSSASVLKSTIVLPFLAFGQNFF